MTRSNAAFDLPASLRRRLLSPALVVSIDAVRENARRVIDALGGIADRWRPHVKTSKIVPVFEVLAAAGIRAFKCATVREAAFLLPTLDAAGGGDVLLAHPVVGPNLERLAALAAAHPRSRVSVLAEDPDAVAEIPAPLGVLVDVNPGMDRTGIPDASADDQVDTAVRVARAAGPRFRGVHSYEGHLAGRTAEERRAAAFATYDRAMDVRHAIVAAGLPVEELVTSGTPTFTCAAAFAPFAALGDTLHRVSPGTATLHDTRTEDEHPDIAFVPAAVVFTRVVSHPRPDVVTCDAGSKAIATDAGDPCVRVLDHDGLVALRPSEEHLPLRVESGTPPPRGTELLLFPRHVCPTVNLAERVVLLEAGRSPRFVPVDARAHDLLLDDP
jgi:D-serine deaminase-like pyridoxal phosphate-dependent protein